MTSANEGQRLRAAAGVSNDETVLLSVGRLEQNKGFHVLIEALAALRAHAASSATESWKWVPVGDGPYRGAIERAVERLGLRIAQSSRVALTTGRCMAGTRLRTCSCTRPCTKAARWSRSRSWRTGGRSWQRVPAVFRTR